MKTKELKDEISDLPTEGRAKIVEWVLEMETLNHVRPEIEKAWAKEARRRLK